MLGCCFLVHLASQCLFMGDSSLFIFSAIIEKGLGLLMPEFFGYFSGCLDYWGLFYPTHILIRGSLQ